VKEPKSYNSTSSNSTAATHWLVSCVSSGASSNSWLVCWLECCCPRSRPPAALPRPSRHGRFSKRRRRHPTRSFFALTEARRRLWHHRAARKGSAINRTAETDKPVLSCSNEIRYSM